MLEKGIWEMKGGWDLQMGVRRSHRNSDWIDQLTLKEGPLGAGSVLRISIADDRYHMLNSGIQALRPIGIAFVQEQYSGGYLALLMTTTQKMDPFIMA